MIEDGVVSMALKMRELVKTLYFEEFVDWDTTLGRDDVLQTSHAVQPDAKIQVQL